MKFANLVLDKNKKMENIGDWAQIFAIENLYRYMGIDYKNVVRINISDLNSYDGETVVLPINFPFYGHYKLSPKIIPVFLGISVMSGSVAEGLRMGQYQPIGCRDIHSLQEIQKRGLEAYYGGCLTIAFPKRDTKIKGNKIFIVDVPDDVVEKFPEYIRQDAEYIKHVNYNEQCKGEEKAKEIYKRYWKEAKLVITSRIHCAQPCIAAGIPVVFICKTVSFRYEVLRQFVPIYTLENIDRIDWNPPSVDIEDLKDMLLENASIRVRETFNKYERIYEINDFYSKGNKLIYKIDSVWAFEEYIKEKYNESEKFSYILWGKTQIADVFYNWMTENYPNATLELIIDISSRDIFYGHVPIGVEGLEGKSDIPVFVTAGAANTMAIEQFRIYGIKKYVMCYNGLYIVDGIQKTY